MSNRQPPLIDMTPDGRFREPPRTPLATRIAMTAVAVAAVTGIVAVLVLMLWFALALIPLALGAALVAYAAFRFQIWRVRRNAAGRNLYRF